MSDDENTLRWGIDDDDCIQHTHHADRVGEWLDDLHEGTTRDEVRAEIRAHGPLTVDGYVSEDKPSMRWVRDRAICAAETMQEHWDEEYGHPEYAHDLYEETLAMEIESVISRFVARTRVRRVRRVTEVVYMVEELFAMLDEEDERG